MLRGTALRHLLQNTGLQNTYLQGTRFNSPVLSQPSPNNLFNSPISIQSGFSGEVVFYLPSMVVG